MENNSLIQGTIWYWRKGHESIPIHSYNRPSGNFTTDELCLVFSNEEQAKLISEELSTNGIHVLMKYVQSSSKGIQEGDGILYTRAPHQQIDDEEEDFEDVARNLKKLKSYIFQNGGKIHGENTPKPTNSQSVKKFSLFRFLMGGRK